MANRRKVDPRWGNGVWSGGRSSGTTAEVPPEFALGDQVSSCSAGAPSRLPLAPPCHFQPRPSRCRPRPSPLPRVGCELSGCCESARPASFRPDSLELGLGTGPLNPPVASSSLTSAPPPAARRPFSSVLSASSLPWSWVAAQVAALV